MASRPRAPRPGVARSRPATYADLGPDILVPDLAGWRRERLPSVIESLYASVAPDWICEVLSPSTYRLDRVKKLRAYAREKVAFAWLVNPIERTLEILRLKGGQWVIVATRGTMRAQAFREASAAAGPSRWLRSRGRCAAAGASSPGQPARSGNRMRCVP